MNEENKLVEVPEIVGYWIEEHKKWGSKIYEALSPSLESIATTDFNEEEAKYCVYWCLKNSEEFASAWVNGYEVDEKHYYVAIPVEGGRYRRLLVYNNGTLALDDHNYYSIDKLIEHTKNSTTQITEKMIKDSPLSWAWQFARELEL